MIILIILIENVRNVYLVGSILSKKLIYPNDRVKIMRHYIIKYTLILLLNIKIGKVYIFSLKVVVNLIARKRTEQLFFEKIFTKSLDNFSLQ